MKIAGMYVRIHAPIYLALIVLGLIVTLRLYYGGRIGREEGRLTELIDDAWRKGTEDGWREGLEHCRALSALRPNYAPALLHAAAFSYRLKEYADAERDYQAAAESERASKEQQANALLGLAAAKFAGGGGRTMTMQKREEALAQATELCRKASALEPLSGSASAALGILAAWKPGEAAAREAEALLETGLGERRTSAGELAHPPSVGLLREAYNALGVVRLRLGRPAESAKAFNQAVAVARFWNEPMLNRRQALLAGLTADGLSVVEREKALAEVERLGVSTFKPNEAEAHLIIASGWWRLGKEQPEEEWLTKTLPKAKSAFQQLIRLTPEEARGYERLALLLEENAALFVAKLPAEYLARFLPPAVNPWRDAPPGAAPPPNPEERRIAAEAVKALEEWRQLRRAQMEKTVSTPEEIRFFSGEIVRRMRLAAALKNTEGERRTILGRTIKDDLAKVPSEIEADDDAEAALQRARLLADLGQWAEALPILTRHAGRLEPALREEIARLNGVPRLFDPFPHANAAPRARVGLISVSIDPAGALAPPKADAVSATLDGRPMTNGLFAGTQLCFPPASLPLAHGKHQVEFTLKTTGGEQKLTTAFTVDKQGPEIVAETSAVEPLPPGKPTWKIQISDPDSGPALDTVEVHLKTDRKSSPRSPIVDKPLVVGGRYALTMSELNVKKGDVLLGESFQVVSPAELRQGTYVLTVRCADRLGNQAEFKRAWTVK